MRRRDFIALLGYITVAGPLAARAQQSGKPVIGYLGPTTAENDMDRVGVFVQRLDALGWFEGRNFEIEYRWAEGHPEAVEQIAAEFVHLKVAAIVTYGTAAVMAAKRSTSEIPIVFGAVGDPVGNGLVANLALSARLPTIYNFREYAQAGLMSYGPSIGELFRRLGDYVDKILRGTKPSEIPVEQPTRIDPSPSMSAARAYCKSARAPAGSSGERQPAYRPRPFRRPRFDVKPARILSIAGHPLRQSSAEKRLSNVDAW